jgi:hypothetical protein
MHQASTQQLTYDPSVGDVWFDCGDEACACAANFSTLLGESRKEGFFLADFDFEALCLLKLSVFLRLEDENMMMSDASPFYADEMIEGEKRG